MSDLRPALLVVGGPDSGKSTYRAQLYQRVEHQNGELRLVESVGDMTALHGDVSRLVQGLQPMHTNLDIYHSTTFVVADRTGRQLSVEFADYGGEQIRRIGESNSMPVPWINRAKESSSWLFFLRIDQIRSIKSFMTEPVQTQPRPKAKTELPVPEQSAELGAIETLQRLLFARGSSLRYPLTSPRLGIFLSCWDELGDKERSESPSVILANRAPLFSRFINANWRADECMVWGVSSTEQKLPETIADVEFARRGPEHAGYIVPRSGGKSPDLTAPIAWLMPRA